MTRTTQQQPLFTDSYLLAETDEYLEQGPAETAMNAQVFKPRGLTEEQRTRGGTSAGGGNG